MTSSTDLLHGARTVDLSAFGVAVRLRLAGRGRDELVERVLHRWSGCGVHEVANAGESGAELTLLAVLDPDEAVHEATWELGGIATDALDDLDAMISPAVTIATLEAASGTHILLHAAGLADTATGRTAILVGSSGTGKSSASRTLGTRFGYVSDETIAVTTDLRILPYAKPLSLALGRGGRAKVQHPPNDLDLLPAPDRLTVGPVLFLTRDADGPSVPELEPIPTIEALALAAENSSYLRTLDQPLHRLAEVIDAGGGAHRVTYREAAELEPILTELLAEPANAEASESTQQPPLSELSFEPDSAGRSVQRLPLLDLYVTADGGAAMTTDGRVVVLSPMATRVMTLVDADTVNTVAVSAALTAEFGAPPDDQSARLLTEDVVAGLIGSGLVAHIHDS